MPTAISESATWTDSISCPDPNEDADANQLETMLTTLANRTRWLRNRIAGSNPDGTELIIRVPITPFVYSEAEWVAGIWNGALFAGGMPGLRNATVGGDVLIDLTPSLPPFGTIRSIVISAVSSANHASGMPDTPPHYWLLKADAFEQPAIVDQWDDPSASVAAYQAQHTVGRVLAVPEPLAVLHKRLFLAVRAEQGANALPGYVITDITLRVAE